MDFVHDRLADGRPFRLLTLVDNFSRVSPAIECDFSFEWTTSGGGAGALERERLAANDQS